MDSEPDNIDVLQNLEFAIVEVWRDNPEMTDHVALRAYEAARQFYRAELRGQSPKLPALAGLDAVTFDRLKSMCEFRLGRSTMSPDELEEPIEPISVEELLTCLQELAKSVERHTRASGRQGYLRFIDEFMK